MTVPGVRERLLIILLALLQSLLLYAAWHGGQAGWWPFTTPQGPVYWYTLTAGLLLVMMLSLVRLGDARFWQHVGGLSLSLAGLAGWAGWHVAAEPAVQTRTVLLPYALSMAIGLYVLTPFLQARLATGQWRSPYPELVRHAWQNGVTLLLALVFVALGWGVLLLSAGLFRLIDIDGLDRLLDDELFVIVTSGALFGTGIALMRSRLRTIQTLLHIVVGLFTGLLPVLSLVILAFLASLAVGGFEQLWDGSQSIWRSTSAAGVLSALLASQILFLNAVFQDGTRPAPYPRLFRGVIGLALLALPVIAALALYAMWLRIDEYGLTVQRFWAAAAVAVLALHSVGYALMQLVPHRNWLGHLPRVNVTMALVLLAVIIAGNSPLLDPHRLSAESQLQRLRNLAADEMDERDLAWLRFSAGRYGIEALRTLQAEARGASRSELADRIARHLDSRSPRPMAPLASAPARPDPVNPPRTGPLQASVPEGNPPLEEAYLRFLRSDAGAVANCSGDDADCLVVRVDANGDGRDERLLCNLALPGSISCRLTLQQEDGSWRWLTVIGWPRTEATEQAIREGDIRTVPSPWQSLQAGDGPVFHLADPERPQPALRPAPLPAPRVSPDPEADEPVDTDVILNP